MPQLESTLVATLKDHISGPASKAGRAIDGLVKKANRSGGRAGMLAGINARATEASRGLLALGGAAGGIALATKSFKDFADFDRHMTRIGITADASAQEVADAQKRVREIAASTGVGLENVVTGLDSLTASGRNMKDALAFLPAVAKTAQASGADVADMAASADALGANLKVNAQDMQTAFDILAKAGKAGKFELKDMAQFLPSLAAAGNAVGLSGLDGTRKMAAMLQVIRTQTGTAGEAATNLQNVFQKMTSQETVNKFKKMGVKDLRGQLDSARKSGKDVLETFLDITEKATKGDLSKVPLLFNDAQMQAGMRALVGQRDMLRRLYADLGNSAGTVDRDFKRVSNDAAASMQRLADAVESSMNNIGASLDKLGASDQITKFAKDVNEATDSFNSLVKNLQERGLIGGVYQTVVDDNERAKNTPSKGSFGTKSAWEIENDRLRAIIDKRLEDDDDYGHAKVAKDRETSRYEGGVAAGTATAKSKAIYDAAVAKANADMATARKRLADEQSAARVTLNDRNEQEFRVDHPDFKAPARPYSPTPNAESRAGQVPLPPPRPPEISPVVNTDAAKAQALDLQTTLQALEILKPTVNVQPGGSMAETIQQLERIRSLQQQINSTSVSVPMGGPGRAGSHGSFSDIGIR